jgi:hypothetical protein
MIFKCAWVCMWPHPGGRSTWPQARSHQGGILGCVGLRTAQAFSCCGMPHVCFWPGTFVHLFIHLLFLCLHSGFSLMCLNVSVCPYCITFCNGALHCDCQSSLHANGSILFITIAILSIKQPFNTSSIAGF